MLLTVSGCRVLSPVEIPVSQQHVSPALLDTDEPQVEIGRPQPILDGIGWVVGIPDKILLWDRRVDRHKISEDTLLAVADYAEANNLAHVKIRANQYAPLKDWERLKNNTTVAWPWRYTFGLVSLAGETLLPGRVFGGDHFNPYTQTIHLYSDVPAIALHEAAHAKDFTRRKYQGTYAAAYAVLPLWHETLASEDVYSYLHQRGDGVALAEADRILYPAYGTYIGNTLGNFTPQYALPVFYASVLAGHVNGRILAREHQDAGFPEASGVKQAIATADNPDLQPPIAQATLIQESGHETPAPVGER